MFTLSKMDSKTSKNIAVTCPCGSVYHHYQRKAHFNTKKHRSFLGEDCPRKEYVMVNPVRGKRSKVTEPDKNSITYIIRLKVADCNEEQLKIRRTYLAEAMRRYRKRKKVRQQDVQSIDLSIE